MSVVTYGVDVRQAIPIGRLAKNVVEMSKHYQLRRLVMTLEIYVLYTIDLVTARAYFISKLGNEEKIWQLQM